MIPACDRRTVGQKLIQRSVMIQHNTRSHWKVTTEGEELFPNLENFLRAPVPGDKETTCTMDQEPAYAPGRRCVCNQ